MKLRNALVLAVLTLASAAAPAQPTVQLTLRSYEDLCQAIKVVAEAVQPSSQDDYAQQLGKHLGMTNLGSFDAKRPWEMAVWVEQGGRPLLALKGPIKELAAFKDSLDPDGLLHNEGKEWKQLDNGLASVTFKPSDELSETEAAALKEWSGQAIQAPKRALQVSVKLSEATRTQAKSLLGFARMSLGQAVESGQVPAAGGANPKAMTAVLGAYFDLIDTFLSGFQELRFGVDVTPDSLRVEELITAKAGSELAKWMETPADHLTASDLSGLDPESLFSVAGYFGKNESLMKIVKQFTALGLQMQNTETNEALAKDINALIDRSLPMKFSGSAYLKDQLSFTGAYTFPAGHAEEVYAQMKRFINQSLKSQVGEGKVYSEVSLAEKHHTVDGVPVDRFTLALNLDNPAFKLPGQKEQLEAFWPQGKMEFDYALKDGKLLLASVRGNQMQTLLAGKSNPKGSLDLMESPCLAGYFNLLGFVNMAIQANPMVPEQVKEKMAKLDPRNTTVEFQVSLNQQMHATARVPLQLLREMGRLHDSP